MSFSYRDLARAVVVVIVALLSCQVAATVDSSSSSYEGICDQMIQMSRRASNAYNAGKVAEAQRLAQSVKDLFEVAIRLEPKEPQAYLTMGTFQSNSHDYDEAVKNFDKAMSLLDATSSSEVDIGEIQGQISKMRQQALYKKYSKLRDEAYNQGKGNATLAYQYAQEQLKYSPFPHYTNHEVGTMQAMLCEYNEELCVEAHRQFRVATYGAYQMHFNTRAQELEGTEKMHCLHSRLQLGKWSEEMFPNVTVQTVLPGVYVNTLQGKYDIVGNDGVIVAHTLPGSGQCNVLTPTGDYYLNLAENLHGSLHGGRVYPVPPPSIVLPQGSKVFSLVQFASATFYHWLVEAVPKLLIFQTYTPEADEYKFLLPSVGGKVPPFILETMSFFKVPAKRMLQYRGPQGLTIDTRAKRKEEDESTALYTDLSGRSHDGALVTVSWAMQPCTGEEFPSDVIQRRVCASLPPAEILPILSLAITSAALPAATLRHTDKYIVIASRGKNATSRAFNETQLAVLLEKELGKDIKVKIVDAGTQSFANTLSLFRYATAVVGAHGGALANIVACKAGTPVVEIGFNTIAAQQYRHIAAALGLRYERVRVAPDPLQRALNAPTLNVSLPEVVTVTKRLVLGEGSGSDEL